MERDRTFPRTSRPLRGQRFLVGLTAALLAGGVAAQKVGEGAGGRTVRIMRDSAAARVVTTVYEGLFSYVRIERAENAAAPNRFPVALSAPALRKALAALQHKGEALFNEAELDEIVAPLVTALGRASADQDVSFAVSGRHSGWIIGATRSVTTGRLFRDAQGLQLVIGLAQRQFEGEFNATGILIPFEPGRRSAAVDASIKLAVADPANVLRRGDWVTLAVESAPAASVPAAAGTAAAAAPAVAPTPGPAVVPLPAPAAAAAEAPRPPADADALYRNISERLKALNRLRDSGLITPQEYEQKRRQILGEL